MATSLTLDLSEKQHQTLTRLRDHHDKPYVRERAAALLKIADGRSGRWVALNGLHQRRDPDTVYGWFHRYQEEGTDGLFVREGRGRKPAFSP
ncbi:MAG: hypothetical protein BRD40_04310 [Bacteroidetes bacterium QS_1_65_9]|nr:MAG: hypothetical protein BRD40_04310 [Bacteroidetes bacterium QS_1_65_9]